MGNASLNYAFGPAPISSRDLVRRLQAIGQDFDIVLEWSSVQRGLPRLKAGAKGACTIAGMWTDPMLGVGEFDFLVRRPTETHHELYLVTTDTYKPTYSAHHLHRFVELSVALCEQLGFPLMFCTSSEGEPLVTATFDGVRHDMDKAVRRCMREQMNDQIYVVSNSLCDERMFAPLAEKGWNVETVRSYCVATAFRG